MNSEVFWAAKLFNLQRHFKTDSKQSQSLELLRVLSGSENYHRQWENVVAVNMGGR